MSADLCTACAFTPVPNLFHILGLYYSSHSFQLQDDNLGSGEREGTWDFRTSQDCLRIDYTVHRLSSALPPSGWASFETAKMHKGKSSAETYPSSSSRGMKRWLAQRHRGWYRMKSWGTCYRPWRCKSALFSIIFQSWKGTYPTTSSFVLRLDEVLQRQFEPRGRRGCVYRHLRCTKGRFQRYDASAILHLDCM